MSLKYIIFIFILSLNAKNLLFIHPHSSNRVIHNKYEWDLAYQASIELQELFENLCPAYDSKITPLSYTKLTPYDKISFININAPSYCIILSFHECSSGITTVRLYQPYYENEEKLSSFSSSLSFTPYQYGYRKNISSTQNFILNLQEKLSLFSGMFNLLPSKKAPLKIGIGIESPTILIEIGINSLDNSKAFLTMLADTLQTVFMENF